MQQQQRYRYSNIRHQVYQYRLSDDGTTGSWLSNVGGGGSSNVGIGRSNGISTKSSPKLTKFAPSRTTNAVFVSRYPRSTPVLADATNTAGAAYARIVRNGTA